MENWIYQHVLKTIWFTIFLFSVPLVAGLYVFYQLEKLNRQLNPEKHKKKE